jgi:hypothetical protein
MSNFQIRGKEDVQSREANSKQVALVSFREEWDGLLTMSELSRLATRLSSFTFIRISPKVHS